MIKNIFALILSAATISFASVAAHADMTYTLECAPFGMNQFSGGITVVADQNAHLTSSVVLTLSSVTRVTSPNETANPLPKIESYSDDTLKGELTIVPKGQLMADEATVISLSREAGTEKTSLRLVLELPLKNAKLIRNGVVFEALCTAKPAQQP